jgi:hypothetical protein
MADYTIHKQSDLRWVRASQVIVSPADGTHVVCPIPKNTLVTNIIISRIVGATVGGALLFVGFQGNGEVADPSFFMSSTLASPTNVGVVSMNQGSAPGAGGKYFTTAGAITVTTDDFGGTTSGTFQVFVEYTQIKN